MFQALGNHAEGERLDASDRLVPVLTVGHHAGQPRYSASQRPSSSRSISIVKVTRAMYHPGRLSNKAMDLTPCRSLSRPARRRSSPVR